MNRGLEERIVKVLLFLMASIAVLSVVLIAFFVFREGMPVLMKYGINEVVFGTRWAPLSQVFGIFPMIIGTILVTIVALAVGAPMGVAVAIFLAEICPKWANRIIRPAIELLAGIPSVLYGLFGMVVIRSILASISRGPLGGILPPTYQSGYAVFGGGIVLAIMILPTIINISEDSIRAVPKEYKEGSLALGASKWQTISLVMVPAAGSGILTSIVLGTGRALGETMAIIMVVGNTPMIPDLNWTAFFAPVRTLTGNIALEMGYAGPEHQQALFATGIILFLFIMVLNTITTKLAKRGLKRT